MAGTVCIHDLYFRRLMDGDAIATRVRTLGEEVSRDYAGKRLLCLAILNGSFIFAADLLRVISMEVDICFIRLSSYSGADSTGKVTTIFGLTENIAQRHVLLIEDIIDTGKTLHELLPVLHEKQPASLQVATFLSKPGARRYPIEASYTGFTIPDQFVVGYGLDYNGLGRNLPDLYIRTTEEPQE